MIDEARSRGYALLSKLLLDGVDAAMLERLGEIPVLFEALPDGGVDAQLDALAAEQHAVLSRGVPPFAGVFLDPEGLVAGAAADDLRAAYERFGFRAQRRDVSDDHLGVTLGALAFASTHAGEWEIRALLDHQLLRWLPSFAVAVGERAGFWQTVVGLVVELVSDHRAALGALPTVATPLPEPPALLGGDTGVRDIARYLCTAGACGAYLTRDDIASLGRTTEVPHGFGNRADMLENVLRAAAEYDVDAFAALGDRLAEHDRDYDALGARLTALRPWIRPWRRRLCKTRMLVGSIQAAQTDALQRITATSASS